MSAAPKTYELSTGMELLDEPDVPSVLSNLSARIKIYARMAERSVQTAAAAAVTTGNLLIEAKAKLKHGEWEIWVTENCQLAVSTARAYMRLSKKIQQLDDSNRQRVSDLPLREALKAITTDPTAPPKPAYSRYRENRTDSERASSIFGKAESSLKAVKKLIGYQLPVKRQQLDGLRKKLNDALVELDALDAQAAADAVEVQQ
ncbi:DUF3102 domain-containing protein [Propionivibrio sp.]|uniref:DUF3102 domain-containing protein n=1 Tax=Propionivibrio sp. TaxID=2212460 RepID=UPI003BF062C8